jgi:acylglycerol lipase
LVKDIAKGSLSLVTYQNLPPKPKAVVCMFHGLDSHMDHGAHIADALAGKGYVTVGFDHRGFGRSPGARGLVYSLDQHISDCKKFVDIVKGLYPTLPFFSMGLSMGGMATYYLTLNYPNLFTGAVMMSPAISLEAEQLLQTAQDVKNKIPIANRNPQVISDVAADMLVVQGFSPATGNMLFQVMKDSPGTFSQYSCPFMVIQGGCDKLVKPIGAFDLFRQSNVKGVDKEIQFFDKMWHDGWHEQEYYDYVDKMIAWMDSRLNKRSSNDSLKESEEAKQV